MRPIWKLSAAALIAIAAFGAGVGFREIRSDRQLRQSPCSVEHWNPTSSKFEDISLDVRDCLQLGPEQTVSGTWSDYASGGRFKPDGISARWADAVDLSLDGLQRAKIQWLANNDLPPSFTTSRSYEVKVRGRLGRYDGHPTDATTYVFVVDEVLAASVVTKLD